FSFYFDLIEPFWRTRPAENMSLHRLATLARKQDVTAVVIDDASARQDVNDELLELDELFGGGGTAEAVSFTFLRSPPPHEPVAKLHDDAVIG
ncbi:hypothetical protein, partial [Acetobacter fabarum]|uniref:hypothetical protein n=1 Tax=Acetobacter fabarum TaxID=483199 RepID=UPI00383A75C3